MHNIEIHLNVHLQQVYIIVDNLYFNKVDF